MINLINSTIQFALVEAEKCYNETKTWLAAHRAFAELAASFAFNLTLIRFFAVPVMVPEAIKHLLLGSAAQSVFSFFKPVELETEPGQHAARTSAAFFIGRAGLQTAIHESGHALMALACFKKAAPIISIFPFKGGLTSYAVSYGKTAFGAMLGRQTALVLIAAAGIIATALTASGALAAAHQLEKKHPFTAKCLTYQAAAHVLIDLDYGQKAFLTHKNDLTHDFIYLWQYGGVHPFVPLCLLAALPLATAAYLNRESAISFFRKGRDT